MNAITDWIDTKIFGRPIAFPDPPKPESYIERAERLAGQSDLIVSTHRNGTVTIDGEPPEYLLFSAELVGNIRTGNASGARSRHDYIDGTEYLTIGIPYAAEYEVLGHSSTGPYYVTHLVSAEGDWDDDAQEQAAGE